MAHRKYNYGKPRNQGERLREAINENLGITFFTKSLGKRSPGMWSKYLNNTVNIGPKLGKQIEETFGIRYQWLRYGTGKMRIDE